jgi:hypothetical protein
MMRIIDELITVQSRYAHVDIAEHISHFQTLQVVWAAIEEPRFPEL